MCTLTFMIYVFIIFNKFPVLLDWNLKFLYTKINRKLYRYPLNDFLKYTRYEFATKTRSYRRELLAESWVDDATLLVHSPSSEKQKQPLGDSIFRIYQTVNWGSFAIITKRWSKYLLRTMHSSILDWLALCRILFNFLMQIISLAIFMAIFQSIFS